MKHKICKNHYEARAYEKECSKKDVPFIWIKNGQKFATIHCDLYGLSEGANLYISPRHYVPDIHDAVRAELLKIFEKYSLQKSKPLITPSIGRFEKIPRELAQQCAEEIFDLFMRKISLGRQP